MTKRNGVLRAFALLAVLALAATGSAAARSSVIAPDCANPTNLAGMGPACAVPGGYEITLPDGFKTFTHGPDFPNGVIPGHLGNSSLPSKKPACVTKQQTEFHTRVFYGLPTDVSDKYSKMIGDVRKMIYQANGTVAAEAARFKRKMDIRFACAGGNVSVTRLKLNTTLNATNIFTVMTEMRNAGWVSPYAKYWVWLDGHPVGAPGGIATAVNDSRGTPHNMANVGAGYNLTFGFGLNQGGAGIMLHEGSHNYGAVQSNAPNASGNGHCNDGQDVMCYADGGGSSNYKPNVCQSLYYDCGNDDYFNPKPKAGSYLATRWNLGSPNNYWYSGCSYVTGQLTAPSAGQTGEAAAAPADQDDPTKGVSWVDRGISKTCSSRPFTVSAIVTPPAVHDQVFAPLGAAEAQVPCALQGWGCTSVAYSYAGRAPIPDVDVCFFKGSKQLKCFSEDKYETGKVPSGSTKARIFLRAGATATYVLNAV